MELATSNDDLLFTRHLLEIFEPEYDPIFLLFLDAIDTRSAYPLLSEIKQWSNLTGEICSIKMIASLRRGCQQ
jgi:hypothetical protein